MCDGVFVAAWGLSSGASWINAKTELREKVIFTASDQGQGNIGADCSTEAAEVMLSSQGKFIYSNNKQRHSVRV